MKTMEDLEKIKQRILSEGKLRPTEYIARVAIGMGTCGIAAGARETVKSFMDELEKRKITNVALTQTGCPGRCDSEPLVTVEKQGMEPMVYAHVRPDMVSRIIDEHLMNNKIIDEWRLK